MELASAYDFGQHELIVHVGAGSVLVSILRDFPSLRAIAFGRPEYMAQTRRCVGEAGLRVRCLCLDGDPRSGMPQGGDAYLLAGTLCGDDGDGAVLQAVRRAVSRDGVLLVGERVFEPKRLRVLLSSAGFGLRESRPLRRGAVLSIADPLGGRS